MDDKERIQQLLTHLDQLGYHSFQVKQMIHETVGTTRLDTLTEEENLRLVDTLEEYIRFAIKCLSLTR